MREIYRQSTQGTVVAHAADDPPFSSCKTQLRTNRDRHFLPRWRGWSQYCTCQKDSLYEQETIELVSSVDTERADIFIEPPDCESGDSAEDSGDEEMGGSLDDLSGHPLDVVADVILYKNGETRQDQ